MPSKIREFASGNSQSKSETHESEGAKNKYIYIYISSGYCIYKSCIKYILSDQFRLYKIDAILNPVSPLSLYKYIDIC